MVMVEVFMFCMFFVVVMCMFGIVLIYDIFVMVELVVWVEEIWELM